MKGSIRDTQEWIAVIETRRMVCRDEAEEKMTDEEE